MRGLDDLRYWADNAMVTVDSSIGVIAGHLTPECRERLRSVADQIEAEIGDEWDDDLQLARDEVANRLSDGGFMSPFEILAAIVGTDHSPSSHDVTQRLSYLLTGREEDDHGRDVADSACAHCGDGFVEKQDVMPDGVEWPRFEDGELVDFGSRFEHDGRAMIVQSLRFWPNGVMVESYDGGDGRSSYMGYEYGRKLERPKGMREQVRSELFSMIKEVMEADGSLTPIVEEYVDRLVGDAE